MDYSYTGAYTNISNKDFVTWDDALFATGHKMIDEQHKKLLEIINNLYHSLLELETDEIGKQFYDSINEAKEYVEYHFAAEEKIMLAVLYRDMEEHMEKHRYYTKEIYDRIDAFKKNPENVRFAVKKLIFFLRDWLLDHIAKEDVKFVRTAAIEVIKMKQRENKI